MFQNLLLQVLNQIWLFSTVLCSSAGQTFSEAVIGGIIAAVFLPLLLILSVIGGYCLYHFLNKKVRKYNLKQTVSLLSGPETRIPLSTCIENGTKPNICAISVIF